MLIISDIKYSETHSSLTESAGFQGLGSLKLKYGGDNLQTENEK